MVITCRDGHEIAVGRGDVALAVVWPTGLPSLTGSPGHDGANGLAGRHPGTAAQASKKLVAATLKKRVILHLRAIRRNAPAQEGTVLQLNCCIFY